MADGTLRQAVRRLVPRRVRWLLRAFFKVVTGLYLLQLARRIAFFERQFYLHVEQVDADAEVMDLFLRRLRILEEGTAALQKDVQALTRPVAKLQEEVTSWAQPIRALTAKPTTEPDPSSAAQSINVGDQDIFSPEEANIAVLCRSLGLRCGIGEYAAVLAQRLGGTAVSSVADLPADADIVFIQYEPTLYQGTADIIREIGVIGPATFVVVDAHNILPDVAEELRWHAVVGSKRELYPGTVHLSLCLPLTATAEDGRPRPAIRLGTFGFAFPHKRYELVVELARRLGVPATILAAHNDSSPEASEASGAYIAHLKSLAGGDIEVIDEFLPIEEVTELLRRCSHLISCMEDNGGQSASLRAMAAAGRPLISLPTQPAREIGAVLVDDLNSITLEFLEDCRQLPQPYDGIADYRGLIQRLLWAKSLGRQILHHDSIYLHDPRQAERLDWLRQNINGRAIDVGAGNGFSTNYTRAVAGVDIRGDRIAYASLRYPHIDFRVLDAKVQALPGFDTVIFGEIIEHMPMAEARQMLALWAQSGASRMLLTTPNAGKPNYEDELVHNPEHVWEPTEGLVIDLAPAGYRPIVTTTERGDFLLAVCEKASVKAGNR